MVYIPEPEGANNDDEGIHTYVEIASNERDDVTAHGKQH